MAGRPSTAGTTSASLRVEVLKELQSLIDDRDVRDRIDRGPLAETKGKEHWVLHLLLKAHEASQSRVDTLIGTAYSNLTARLQGLEDRIGRVEELSLTLEGDFKSRMQSVESQVGERVDRGIAQGFETSGKSLATDLGANLDLKWKPVGDSVETFVQASRQLTKEVGDTYRVATQVRLLLNENARRMTDLGRDLVALEESLKLVVARTVEENIQPLEVRIAGLEAHLGLHSPTNTTTPSSAESAEKSESQTGAD